MYKSKANIPASIKAYKKIKADILSNKLKPGVKLVEANLAEQLNISRTPVREALRQLDQDGFVIYTPQRGSIVSQISLEHAQELYEVREVLEGLAIKLICINITEEEITIFKEITVKMEQAIANKDYSEHVLLHKKWTETLLSLTKNNTLKDILIDVNESLGRFRMISLSNTQQNLDAFNEIKEIMKAMEKTDSDECERLARIHVKNAWIRFNTNMNLMKNLDFM